MAWAIGWLAGTAAVLAGRGGRGTPFQVAALVAALVGILVGKYLSFAWLLQEQARDSGVSIGLFASETRSIFRDELGTSSAGSTCSSSGWRCTPPADPERAAQPAAQCAGRRRR